MKKENPSKVIRNAVVGVSAIALLLIILAVMNSIPEIKNTIVVDIISVNLILRLIFLLFVVVALVYLIFPLSAALTNFIINLASESDVDVDDNSFRRIKIFSKRIVIFLTIPFIYLTLIFPLREFAALSERYSWMPLTFVYVILAIMIIILIILLLSIGPFVEALRKKKSEDLTN